MRQVQADRFKKANPKMAVNIDVHGRPDAPHVKFKYIDGTEVSRCRDFESCLLFIGHVN